MASLTDLEARKAELETEIREIDAEFQGEQLDDDAKERWNKANEERDKIKATIAELEARAQRVADLSQNERNTEPAQAPTVNRNRNRNRVPDDPTRLEEYRNLSNSIDDVEQAYRDGAMKLVERMTPGDSRENREDNQANIARMLDTIDENRAGEAGPRSLAKRIIATSSPQYNREFGQYLATGHAGKEMERAASLTAGSGGYAVPVFLDPTVIVVNAGAINPVRQIARVVQTTANTLEYITSTGITAGYAAEATEASDNAPALVQPTANVEKAFAFVPMSIEISQDWGAIQSEMAKLFADAKNRLESTKFLTGLGHGSNEPQGLIAVGGATAVVTSATTAVMALADLYSLEVALAPRWRANASLVGSKAAAQKIRAFATASGPSAWADNLRVGYPAEVLGYPFYEWSDYSSATTTSGSTVLTLGDFNQFLIADRVGMNVELIPHLFGSSNRFPTGQRGLYMYWRNTSKVLTPGLQANSAFVSLKLL